MIGHLWSRLPGPATIALMLCGACAAAAITLAAFGEGPAAVVLGVAAVITLRLAVLFTRPRAMRRPPR